MHSTVFLDREGFHVSDRVFRAPGLVCEVRHLSEVGIVRAPVAGAALAWGLCLGAAGLAAAAGAGRLLWAVPLLLAALLGLGLRRRRLLRLGLGRAMRLEVPVAEAALLRDLVRALGAARVHQRVPRPCLRWRGRLVRGRAGWRIRRGCHGLE